MPVVIRDLSVNLSPAAKSEAAGAPKSMPFVIGATPQTIALADVKLNGVPFTFEVSPDVVNDPAVSIRVEVSFDGGATYQSVGTFSQYASRRWVQSPEESAPTHLLVYRVTGTSVASKLVIGA